MLLRNSEYKGRSTYEEIIKEANGSLGKDMEGYRKEFVLLVKKAEILSKGLATR